MLASEAELRVGDFNTQGLVNTAWAFAMAGEPAPASLDQISVLDVMGAQGAQPKLLDCQMIMEGLAATGQIEAGFVLLTWAEASGLLSHVDAHCYPTISMLLWACRAVCNPDSASGLRVAVERLSLIALAPMAMAIMQSAVRPCENGVLGEGVSDAWRLWLELHHQTAYTPQRQALAWVILEKSTREQQEGSLQLRVCLLRGSHAHAHNMECLGGSFRRLLACRSDRQYNPHAAMWPTCPLLSPLLKRK